MKFGTHLILAFRYFQRVRSKISVVLLCLGLGLSTFYLSIYLNQVVRQETARRFYSQGFDLFSIMKKPGAGQVGPAQIRNFDKTVAEYLHQNQDYVIGAAPELWQTDQIHYENTDIQAPVIGVLENYLNVHGLQISAGREFSKYDSTRSFCIIGHQLMQKIRQSESDSLVGNSIYLGRELVTVIGVLETGSSFPSEYSVDDAVLVPLKFLQQYAVNPEITKITVRANPNQHVSDVVMFLENGMKNYLGDISQFEVSNQGVFLRIITARVKRFSTILGAVGILMLLIGSWSFLRLTIYSILRRRKEMFIVSNFGYKKKSLMWQFLIEIAILISFYLVISVSAGIGLSYILAQFNDWVFFISRFALLATIFVGLFIGLSISVYPTLSSLYSKKLMIKLKEL
jgi:ABC-type antimicrobial peptide transport system permease subunit